MIVLSGLVEIVFFFQVTYRWIFVFCWIWWELITILLLQPLPLEKLRSETFHFAWPILTRLISRTKKDLRKILIHQLKKVGSLIFISAMKLSNERIEKFNKILTQLNSKEKIKKKWLHLSDILIKSLYMLPQFFR